MRSQRWKIDDIPLHAVCPSLKASQTSRIAKAAIPICCSIKGPLGRGAGGGWSRLTPKEKAYPHSLKKEKKRRGKRKESWIFPFFSWPTPKGSVNRTGPLGVLYTGIGSNRGIQRHICGLLLGHCCCCNSNKCSIQYVSCEDRNVWIRQVKIQWPLNQSMRRTYSEIFRYNNETQVQYIHFNCAENWMMKSAD